jgi:hypothetical protein
MLTNTFAKRKDTTFMTTVTEKLTWKAGMKSPDLDNMLAAIDETYQHFSWTIWHEGIRAFDDGYPGAIRDINTVRAEAIQRQAHNPHAQDLIRAASNELLVQYIYQTRARVYGEFQLVANFQWVAYHEGQRDQFRNLLGQRSFNSIRVLYSGKQQHNPNARNLLSAVSNADVEAIVNAL